MPQFNKNIRKPIKFINEAYNPENAEVGDIIRCNSNNDKTPYIITNVSPKDINTPIFNVATFEDIVNSPDDIFTSPKYITFSKLGPGDDKYHLDCNMSYLSAMVSSCTPVYENKNDLIRKTIERGESIGDSINKNDIKKKISSTEKGKVLKNDSNFRFYSLREVADMIHLSYDTVRKLAIEGTLPTHSANGRLYCTIEDINEYLEKSKSSNK